MRFACRAVCCLPCLDVGVLARVLARVLAHACSLARCGCGCGCLCVLVGRLGVLFLHGGGYIVRDCAGGENEESPEAAQREHHDDGGFMYIPVGGGGGDVLVLVVGVGIGSVDGVVIVADVVAVAVVAVAVVAAVVAAFVGASFCVCVVVLNVVDAAGALAADPASPPLLELVWSVSLFLLKVSLAFLFIWVLYLNPAGQHQWADRPSVARRLVMVDNFVVSFACIPCCWLFCFPN